MGADLEFGQLHDIYGAELCEHYEVDGMVLKSVGVVEFVTTDVLSEAQIPLGFLAANFGLPQLCFF